MQCKRILTMGLMAAFFMCAPVYASTYKTTVTNQDTGKSKVVYTEHFKTLDNIEDEIKNFIKSKANVDTVKVDSNLSVSSEPTDASETPKTPSQTARELLAGKLIDTTAKGRYSTSQSLHAKRKVIRTKHLRKTTRKVKHGKAGTRRVTKSVTYKNGKLISSKVISRTVTRKPVPRRVYKGTGNIKARKGNLVTGTPGKDVARYAVRFIGNPYVWGGTSLTHGADCSGFVYRVYDHFGISLPRINHGAVGKRVSVKRLKPGDELHYPGHVAMYIGRGKVVHALNPRLGIRITGINYTGHPRYATRFVK